jgi:hypothetical protein
MCDLRLEQLGPNASQRGEEKKGGGGRGEVGERIEERVASVDNFEEDCL